MVYIIIKTIFLPAVLGDGIFLPCFRQGRKIKGLFTALGFSGVVYRTALDKLLFGVWNNVHSSSQESFRSEEHTTELQSPG